MCTMSGFKAKALYEFRTEIDGELPFCANDILTITNVNVGSGWWEAHNSFGHSGLVPLSYFETCLVPTSQPSWPKANPAQPSPALTDETSVQLPTRRPLPWLPPSSRPMMSASGHPVPPVKPVGLTGGAWLQRQVVRGVISAVAAGVTGDSDNDSEDDEWDDDCEDDDDEYYDEDDFDPGFAEFESADLKDDSEVGSEVGSEHANSGLEDGKLGRRATKQLSRLVHFTKGGGDAFLFEMHPPILSSSISKVTIVETSDGPSWTHGVEPYTCSITSPKKESKFRGIKSFIVYQLTPTFSNIQVSRRYKHFDWLQQRLVEKFSTIAIPPLPEKQISGRFEDDFVSNRLKQLQLWTDRMCNHPVVAQSEVFVHFLSCTDDKKWKIGKRRAEKDTFQGGLFFRTIEAPLVSLDAISVESQMDNFGRFSKSMDDSVRHLCGVGEANVKKQKAFKKEFQRLGGSFTALSKAFEQDERPDASRLNTAIADIGKTYIDVGRLFETQTNVDMVGLLEGLNEYKGLLSTFPDILLVHRASTNKIQESAGKFSESEVQMVQGRADVITYTVLAEMNHFQMQRVVDFKRYMQGFLSGQIQFYDEITQRLQKLLSQIDRA